jgi:ribose transport system substrate-binding protein
MTIRHPAGILALAALSACGAEGPLMRSADGRIQLVFAADAKWLQDEGRREMESALALHPDIDLVFAHNDPMARGAQLAAEQAGRTGIRFVGIDGLPHEGVRYVQEGKLDATFEYPTGGAEAVDLAILLLRGVRVPREITLGTRSFTRDDVDRGGTAVPGPGAVVVEELRAQHAAILENPRRDGRPLRLGMSQCNLAEPWRTQMNEDVRARAAAYGSAVELVERDAQNDANVQREQVLELIAQGVDAILVSPKEEVVLVPATRAAIAAGVPVLVLDRRLGSEDYTCFIGGDNVAIGRTAGEFVARLLGEGGGRIVEIQGLGTSSPARDRHRGFVEALGLEPVR